MTYGTNIQTEEWWECGGGQAMCRCFGENPTGCFVSPSLPRESEVGESLSSHLKLRQSGGLQPD